MKHIWKKDSLYYQQWKEFRLQPNAWDKYSSATKGFWVPLLQIFLYTIHQNKFALQKYIQHPPQGLYLYGGNKAVSQVEEVETVKVIKGNGLTKLKLARVFMFNYPGTYSWVCRRTTREWFVTI